MSFRVGMFAVFFGTYLGVDLLDNKKIAFWENANTFAKRLTHFTFSPAVSEGFLVFKNLLSIYVAPFTFRIYLKLIYELCFYFLIH